MHWIWLNVDKLILVFTQDALWITSEYILNKLYSYEWNAKQYPKTTSHQYKLNIIIYIHKPNK